jgi:DNA-binding transcriptional ArsR family regulator
LRIHFTMEDLARLRMAPSLGPVLESVCALDLFGRHGGGTQINTWRRQVRDQLGDKAGNIDRLAGEQRSTAELLWLFGRAVEPVTGTDAAEIAGARDAQIPDQRLVSAVFEFCQLAILPHCGRITITGGVDRLLGSVHPNAEWALPVLHVPDGVDDDLYLDGRGMVLSPSVFLMGRKCAVVESMRSAGVPMLVFAVPRPPQALADLLDLPGPDSHSLEALMGHTRAAALQALADTSCTTGGLSERLGISMAGASKHVTVLREAGLVTTARNRNTALHALTSLGVALLRSRLRVGGGSRANAGLSPAA